MSRSAGMSIIKSASGCRQDSLDKRLAVSCKLDEEVNEESLEKEGIGEQRRVKPLLVRGVLVKEESHDCLGQQGLQGQQGYQGPTHRCQGHESVLPLSPGILVNGFPL